MILRIKHKHSFTVLSNKMLSDVRLSFKARGLLAFMLTRPDDWKFYSKDLLQHSSKEGICAIYSAIKELIRFGYIIRGR